MNKKEKNIICLFGCGITPEGFPETVAITTDVRNNDWQKMTDGAWYLDNSNSQFFICRHDFMLYLKKYLFEFKEKMQKYDAVISSEVNYEDIYYLAQQIRDSCLREFENPIVDKFVDDLENIEEFQELYQTFKENVGDISFRSLIEQIADLLCESIEYIVSTKLSQGVPVTVNFDNIFTGTTCNYQIFSLNHDILLEKYFKDCNIDFCDGFIKNQGEPHFDMDSLIQAKSRIQLYKLHGSVDWFLDKQQRVVKKPATKDNASECEILIGTFNKYFGYIRSIFLQLLGEFYSSLKKCDLIIVSGYSFGDKAINQILVQAILEKDKKIIVVHPDSNVLYLSSRGLIKKHWSSLTFKGQKIQDVSFAEIIDTE